MKTPLSTLLLLLIPWQGISQNHTYKSLNDLGWELATFSVPAKMTELDTGAVTYLVTIDDAGNVLRLKTLHNTFRSTSEKLWRRALKDSTFKNTAVITPTGKRITATMTITRQYCNPAPTRDPVAPEEQINLFTNP